MSKQPEALRLADLLEERPHDALDFLPVKAAAELRLLHIDNEACGIHLTERMIDLAKVEAQRDALLEALRLIAGLITHPEGRQKALDAIAKVEAA